MSERIADVLVTEIGPDALNVLAERLAPFLEGRLAGEPDRPMNVTEAAEHLRCAPKRIYDLVSQHRITPIRDGSRLLFRRSALDAYLDGKTPPR